MTAILDQSDLTDRAARLVEAAKRAGAGSGVRSLARIKGASRPGNFSAL